MKMRLLTLRCVCHGPDTESDRNLWVGVHRLIELARQHRLTITHAVETHIHADFDSGSRESRPRQRNGRLGLPGRS